MKDLATKTLLTVYVGGVIALSCALSFAKMTWEIWVEGAGRPA